MKQIGLRWPEGLIERIDAVLPEGVSRSEFIRRCVLVALEHHEPLGVNIGEPPPTIQESTQAYERALTRGVPEIPGLVPATALPCSHDWQYDRDMGEMKCWKCKETRDE